jgi:2'-5' RNA ligase
MAAAARNVPSLTLTIGGAGCFPNLKRPRVVWIGISEPTGKLNSLQRAIESTISPLGYPAEGAVPAASAGPRRATPYRMISNV